MKTLFIPTPAMDRPLWIYLWRAFGITWDFGGQESPDPVGNVPKPIGYTISLHVTQPAGVAQSPAAATNSAELLDGAGVAVPFYFLNRGNGVGADDFYIVPKQPLKNGVTYRVRVNGVDGAGVPLDVSWSFTTKGGGAILNPFVYGITSNTALVTWETAGVVAECWIDYGVTSDYGTKSVAFSTGDLGEEQSYTARAQGLAPNTTYRYKITTRDTNGNLTTSPELTFTTKAAQTTR